MYIKDRYKMGDSPAKSSCLPKILAAGLKVTFEYLK